MAGSSLDAEHNNVYDLPSSAMTYKRLLSEEATKTYTAGKYSETGFFVLSLGKVAEDILEQISVLLEKYGSSLLDHCGKTIFNTMMPKRAAAVTAELAKQGTEHNVDTGRSMATQVELSKPLPSPEEEAGRVMFLDLAGQLSALLRSHLQMILNCGDIKGSILSLLRSVFAPAQLPHVDLTFNEKKNEIKYVREQMLALVSLQDETKFRVLPRTHKAKTLNGLDKVCENGFDLILNKFDVVIMHPKTFHAGGECTTALNYRLHFYFGFGAAVESNNKIFDTTHFPPAQALKNAVGVKGVKGSEVKKAKKESQKDSFKRNLCQGNDLPDKKKKK